MMIELKVALVAVVDVLVLICEGSKLWLLLQILEESTFAFPQRHGLNASLHV